MRTEITFFDGSDPINKKPLVTSVLPLKGEKVVLRSEARECGLMVAEVITRRFIYIEDKISVHIAVRPLEEGKL